MYSPKALDTDKMEELFNDLDKYQSRRTNEERIKLDAYYSGYNAALHDCRQSLYCSNYEFDLPESPRESAKNALYELCKELDIQSQDLRDDDKLSIDEMVAKLAERIKAIYNAE